MQISLFEEATEEKTDDKELKELPIEFIGRGEVKGFRFKQIKRSDRAYIFEVSDDFGKFWYEVFTRKIDSRFGKIAYPKSSAFGVWAWSARTMEKAWQRLEKINISRAVKYGLNKSDITGQV